MIKVAQFMKAHGMDAERIDLSEYTKEFACAMRRRLAQQQKNMPMLPTYLYSSGKLKKGEKAIVIDAGGTNFRRALIGFDGKKAVIDCLDKRQMPGTEEPATWNDFISGVADCVQPLIKQTKNIGFCFSYPVEITPECDGKVLGLTKQVKIEGASGSYLGASLRAELEKRGEQPDRIVVLNDTPATLLAGKVLSKGSYDGYIGLVAGTPAAR